MRKDKHKDNRPINDTWICDDRLDRQAYYRYIMSLTDEEFEKQIVEAQKNMGEKAFHEKMVKKFPA